MGFFQNIFGGNKADANNANSGDNFVVDETGVAQEASTAAPIASSAPSPVNASASTQPVAAPFQQPTTQSIPEKERITSDVPVAPTAAPEIPVTSAAPVENSAPLGTSDSSQDEAVGSTKAFEDLMAQAEASANVVAPDQPVLDPELQKVKEEMEREDGIELFPAD